jgi:hypothetical protein
MSVADEILNSTDTAREAVDVPKWGRKVVVREMSGTERDEWEQVAFGAGTTKDHFRAKLLVHTLHDEEGNRIFTAAQVEALAGKSGTIINELYDVAARLNGLRKSDEDDAVKNS